MNKIIVDENWEEKRRILDEHNKYKRTKQKVKFPSILMASIYWFITIFTVPALGKKPLMFAAISLILLFIVVVHKYETKT